jgi:hypothetical protein
MENKLRHGAYIGSALVSSHRADMGNVVDVLEVRAASIFIVWRFSLHVDIGFGLTDPGG